MKLKKRKKAGRMRGTRLHGWAAKKHKGSGNRGGKGMAGTGKRADQRKTYVLKYLFPYFGKKGFTSRGTKKDKGKRINIGEIEKNIGKHGKKAKEGIEVNLPEYKILGDGEIKEKMIVKASAFSSSAKEKIEKAGGKVIVLREKAGKEKKKKEIEKEKR